MRKVKKYKVGGLTPNGVGIANTDLDFLNQNALADMNAKFGQNLFAGKDYRTFNPSSSLNMDNISSGIGSTIDLFTNAISSSKQKYDTVKQARMATATNSLTGLAKGAQAGAAIGGPVGAAIGAGAGLWSGLIGGKNKVSDSGFYEDPTLQYGTGIIGAIGRDKAEDKYQELLRKAIDNRNARAVGQKLSTDWLLNYDSENNVFAANGGNVSDLAWLDDGELFKTPDQQIYSVPEQGQPEDSNLLSIPDGTKVLSDKLKVPGTKETFANMAKRLTSNKSKYNDKYAQGAAEANAINDKIVFDTLFDIQEGMKNGKKEYKAGLQEFQKGGKKEEYQLGDNTGNYGTDFVINSFRGLGNIDNWINVAKMMFPGIKLYDLWNRFNSVRNSAMNDPDLDRTNYQYEWQYEVDPLGGENMEGRYYPQGRRVKRTPSVISDTPVEQVNTNQVNTGKESVEFTPYNNKTSATQYSAPTRQSVSRSTTSRFTLTPQQIQVQDTGLDMLPKPVDVHNIAVQELSTPVQQTQPVTTAPNTTSTIETRSPYDWEQLATDITSLLPVFSNLGERPETFASVHNPYTNAALNTLGRRRYDIRPTINAIRRGMASNNYAMSQNNTNTGANLAFRLQNAVNTNNAINTAYAQAAEMNNTYAADYANALDRFGQQYVQARNTAIDQNARSRAQARNINRTGLSQLSNYAQNRLLMRNQREADAAMLDLYKPLLDAGFTTQDYSRLMNKYRRR